MLRNFTNGVFYSLSFVNEWRADDEFANKGFDHHLKGSTETR